MFDTLHSLEKYDFWTTLSAMSFDGMLLEHMIEVFQNYQTINGLNGFQPLYVGSWE